MLDGRRPPSKRRYQILLPQQVSEEDPPVADNQQETNVQDAVISCKELRDIQYEVSREQGYGLLVGLGSCHQVLQHGGIRIATAPDS